MISNIVELAYHNYIDFAYFLFVCKVEQTQVNVLMYTKIPFIHYCQSDEVTSQVCSQTVSCPGVLKGYTVHFLCCERINKK